MNQLGFSLLQVLFASSVLGALSLQGVKMLKDQEDLARLTTQRFEIQYILDDMMAVLRDPASCQASLSSADPEAITEIQHVFRDPYKNQDSRLILYQTFASSQKTYGQDTVKIQSYRLKLEGNRPTEGQLEVIFQRDENQTLTREIPLLLTWQEDAQTISTCRLADSAQNQNFWSTPKFDPPPPVDARPLQSNNPKISLGRLLGPLPTSLHGHLLAQTSPRPACHAVNGGSVLYDQELDRWLVCEKSNWRPLGEVPWLELASEQLVQLENPLRAETQIEAQLCILSEFRSKSGSSRCTMTSPQEPKGLERDPGFWRLQITALPENDLVRCLFRCYR